MSDFESINLLERDVSTLRIFHNGQTVHYKIEDIFDSKKYDTFTGITFSADPSFINKYLKDFQYIKLIIGLPEEKLLSRINQLGKQIASVQELYLNNKPAETYRELSSDIKQKLAQHTFDFKIPIGYSIHSKFYLMSHSKTGATRLITGSANLSTQAFSDKTNQFETVSIFDNDENFDLYTTYLQEDLEPFLIDYFPKTLQDINIKQVKNVEQGSDIDINTAYILNDDDLDKISQDGINESLDQIANKLDLGILPTRVTQELANVTDGEVKKAEKKVRMEEEVETEDISYELVTKVVTKKGGIKPKTQRKTDVKKALERTKQVKKIAITVEDKEIENELDDARNKLYLFPNERDFSEKQTGLFKADPENKKSLLPIGKPASTEEIRESLSLINRYIKSYEENVVDYSDDYGARIMETLFYVFSTPFISEIKNKLNPQEAVNIPQFLFLGGVSDSGKTSLLTVLSKMTVQYKIPEYEALVPNNYTTRAKKKVIDTLQEWLTERGNNVAPIFADEIKNYFFDNKQYGENLILSTANLNVKEKKITAAFVGTTNAEEYALAKNASKRSYYLKFDKAFKSETKREGRKTYQDILQRSNNVLFEDFVVRMSEKLTDTSLEWAKYDEVEGKEIDFLYHTREIFKHYYQEADMPLPRYFPTTRYDDNNSNASVIWRDIYLGDRDHFTINGVEGYLQYRISRLDENVVGWNKSTSEKYVKMLPPEIYSSKNEVFISFYPDRFFDWIEEPNTFIQDYKHRLKKLYKNQKSLFQINKRTNDITIDLSHISDTPDDINRYKSYTPEEIILKSDDSKLTLEYSEFLNWLGIEEKTSWFSKFI